jgi:soluble lytic murein transglycosylase-like protein
MRGSFLIVTILTAGVYFALGQPIHAQITTSVDGNGKLIFVNADSPKARRGSTISPVTIPVPGFRARNPEASPDAAFSSTTVLPPPGFSAQRSSATSVIDQRLDRIVRDAAARHDVDPALVKAVISTESGWNPQAVSRKGAVGLMQLIPGTAQRFGVNNSFDPAQNVEGGTTYLKALLDRYNGDLSKSLAAYNAGEHAVDMHGGVPAYRETQQYVRKVTDAYFRPGSGRNSTQWSPPKAPVRKEVDAKGRIIFTNE